MRTPQLIAALLCLASARPATAVAQNRTAPNLPEAQLVARARQIHDRVMTMDTHVDISPAQVPPSTYLTRPNGQVDIARMESGGLDAVFFSIYVGQTSGDSAFTPAAYKRVYDQAIDKILWVHALAETVASDKIGLAFTPADATRIYASGRKVAFMGVENAYSLGEDINNIRKFAEYGVRYMSLAHNGHSQYSDSNTGEAAGWKWNGLSPLGKQAVAEMNKWGIMIDFSHPSKAAMMQILELSKAPIMGSHSGVRAICNHSRNADDEQLQALKRNGGVIQLVAFANYVKCDPDLGRRRTEAVNALRTEFGLPPAAAGGGGGGARGGGRGAAGAGAAGAGAAGAGAAGGGGGGGRGASAIDSLPPARLAQYEARLAEVNARFPQPTRATVKDFADHIDYTAKLIGIDHIGISSDFDGGGGVEGWNSAAETFNVTLELFRRGYTEAEIAKIWSGNLLRVLGEVQRISKQLQAPPR
jgi:membrane dipeptidase